MLQTQQETHLVFPELGIVHVLLRSWSANGRYKTANSDGVPCTSAFSRSPPSAAEMSAVNETRQPTQSLQFFIPFGQDARRDWCFMDLCFSTFAISLQLFPASLICLSLCSSAGVHGVFVRLFFALGSWAGGSTSAAEAVAVAPPAGAPALVAVLAMCSCCWRLTDLRFRALPGVGGCGAFAKGS